LRIIPKIKFKLHTHADGYRYAIVYRDWFWQTTLFKFPIDIQFWPRDLTVPLPKGTRFPKQPTPTEAESKAVADMMDQRGYKILHKYWNWMGITLAYRCTSEKDGEAQGLFQGFLRARLIPQQIAKWGQEQRAESVEGTEEDMYLNQLRMDRQADTGL